MALSLINLSQGQLYLFFPLPFIEMRLVVLERNYADSGHNLPIVLLFYELAQETGTNI
jgi:hypothetical protein